jgi:hypothetical protein
MNTLQAITLSINPLGWYQWSLFGGLAHELLVDLNVHISSSLSRLSPADTDTTLSARELRVVVFIVCSTLVFKQSM